jgi:hypothetical protein
MIFNRVASTALPLLRPMCNHPRLGLVTASADIILDPRVLSTCALNPTAMLEFRSKSQDYLQSDSRESFTSQTNRATPVTLGIASKAGAKDERKWLLTLGETFTLAGCLSFCHRCILGSNS